MQPNSIIQSYRLLSRIGEGGMGEVWLAEHISVARNVAIKILHPQFARNESLRSRFRNEAITLSKLQHPNIVAFYDFIEDRDMACLVMEYVEGRNLDDVIRKEMGPIPAPRLGEIFKQILLAFGHAHKMGVVHRDIKPSNFMLTDDGRVKVLDFGIAKLLDDDLHLTRTGMRMGTTYYMSPEQVNGGKVDHRSDIYALGVTLFTMATGKNPYDGEQVEFKVYHRILHEPLPNASAIYPAVPGNIDLLVAKATCKDPEQRFQSCEDFLVGRGIGRQQVMSQDFTSAPLARALPSLPIDDAFKKKYWLVRRYAWVCAIGGLVLSPLFVGMAGLLGGGVSVGIAVCSIGFLQRLRWSKGPFPILLMLHIALCMLVGAGTLSRTTHLEYVSQGFETRFHETHGVTFTGDAYVWLVSLIFAAVGLVLLYSRKGRSYFEE
jgi:serine/threonine protein kinase